MSERPSHLSGREVCAMAIELGADDAGIARVHEVRDRSRYLEWLGAGYAGEMLYLSKHQDLRFAPDRLLPGARSVIVVGLNYCPSTADVSRQEQPFNVAKYAWGTDYHLTLRRLLRRLRSRLKLERPGLRGRICVDTAPFCDKYWAVQAGLGWAGKHTNVVSRRFGSWLLIGSLLVDADMDAYDAPHADFCGTCRACLDACPTAAFPAPYLLNAQRCISYWTIESRRPEIPDEIASRQSGWVFGCDICLDACPWNRFERPHTHATFARHPATGAAERGALGDCDPATFAHETHASPLRRPGSAGFRRNVRAAADGQPVRDDR